MIESWKPVGATQKERASEKQPGSKYLNARQKSKPAQDLGFCKPIPKERLSIDRPIKNFKGGFI